MTNPLRFNEGKACDAVLRHLEKREAAARTHLRFPDREGHSAPVELVCKLGSQLYALEHTGVEPFEGHMRGNAENERLWLPVVSGVAGRIPRNDDFALHVPVRAMEDQRARDIPAIQGRLIEWVVATAPGLWIPPRGRMDTQIKPVRVEGVPFDVTLYRMEGFISRGKLQIVHAVADIEEGRLERITISLRKKMPKLSAWKRDAAARTVLVLEENDIQLTNCHVVTSAVLEAEKNLGHAADEIYLVTTSFTPWQVHFLRVDDRTYFDLTDPDERSWGADPTQLVSLTGR
jgi:hypothetical protein